MDDETLNDCNKSNKEFVSNNETAKYRQYIALFLLFHATK